MVEVMGFEEEQNGAPGCVPQFGAIFMSNRATKKECFKRKLLGLSSGMANFVKQVKAGMILFLFEFEKRELHGVFQASSDGAMNIVTHAYVSSGKQFPAQVKFTPVWCCSPLCEDEFKDAIKENYFSKNKFNFGLSEDQVHKLLSLFSLRKLKVQPHRKHFSLSKVPSYSMSKFRRADDVDRSTMKNQLTGQRNANCHCRSIVSNEYFVDSLFSGGTTDGGRTITSAGELNEYKVGNQFGKVISKDYFEESLHEAGRVTSDGRFATTDCVRNESNMDIDLRAVISSKYPHYSFDNEVRKISNDARFSKVNRLGLGNNGDNGYGTASSTVYPGSDQFNSYTASYTYNSDIVQADSFVHKQSKLPLPLPGSMGPQFSKFSCSIPSVDANITSSCPYDPDTPGIDYWPSSSAVNHSSNPVSNSDPSHDSNAVCVFPSVGNQSLLSFVEPVGTRRSFDINSGFESSIPMPLSGKRHEFCGRIGRPFFGTAYSEKVGKDFSKNEDARGISFLETSSASGSFLECRSSDGINEGPSSSSDPPTIVPSFVYDYGYSLTSQEKQDHGAFAGNIPTLKEDHSQLQGHDYPVEFESIDHHDNYSLNPVVYGSSRNMYSGCQKSRISVFSRLGIASEIHMEESVTADDNNEDATGTSAEEIMSMLHQSQYQWVKMRNHTQPTIDNAKNFRKKRQTTSNFELLTVQKMSKEMVMDSTAETEDNDEQFASMTPFVDFKRRSEVRKTRDDDIKISGCNKNAEKSESGGLRKRRKLIRPNFNENELPDVKSIDTSEKVGPHLLCQISHKDKYIEAKRVSNCSGEELVEICGATSRNADKNGKELSPKFGSRNMQLLVSPEEKSCNVDEGLIIKDSMLDGVVQDLKNSSQSTGLQSSLETHENNTEGITATEKVYGSYRDLNISKQSIGQDSSLETSKVNAIVSTSSETESCRGNEKDLYNFDKVYLLDGEMETNRADYSSNQSPKSEKAAENLVGNGSKGCPLDVKQNIANENEVLSSIGDTTLVGCKAISSNLNPRSSQDPADNAVNDGHEVNKHLCVEQSTSLYEAPSI